MAGPYVGRANLMVSYSKGYADLDTDDLGRVLEVEGPLEVVQSCELALRGARPSYIYDVREFFPWVRYLGKMFPRIFEVLSLEVRSVLMVDQRVKSLKRVTVGWQDESNRIVGVEFEGSTHDDDTLVSRFSLNLP